MQDEVNRLKQLQTDLLNQIKQSENMNKMLQEISELSQEHYKRVSQQLTETQNSNQVLYQEQLDIQREVIAQKDKTAQAKRETDDILSTNMFLEQNHMQKLSKKERECEAKIKKMQQENEINELIMQKFLPADTCGRPDQTGGGAGWR